MLAEEDWQLDGGMAIPLVPVSVSSTRPPSIPGPDFTALSSSPRAAGRRSGVMSTTGAELYPLGTRRRWSRLSDFGDSDVVGDVDAAGGGRPRYQTRKRKRWSNSIGSTTTTIIGAVRESVMSIGNAPAAAPVSAVLEEDQGSFGRPREGKRTRFGRVLRGLAASFRGLGAGGAMA
ncbi:MAG: hypothetical protein LQ338_004511 [Usnochroma carphineum]|nr:MAG: hypothetical protein LQ338_004511 [Usnochroma carphineum]